MNLWGKKLAEIREEDLRILIETQVPEGRYIEYQSQLPGRTDKVKKEFLKDISSFANADGGHIIFGIRAEGGIPVEICGLQTENPDEQIQFLENLLRNGVEPHIPGVDFQQINLSGGRDWALVVRIPKSWRTPHMVTLQLRDHERFFGRDSRGRHAFDYHEIRDSFLQFGKNLERIQGFSLNRIEKINGENPLGLVQGPKAVLHLVPLSFLDSSLTVDLKRVRSLMEDLEMPRDFGTSVRYNYDGILLFEPHSKGNAWTYQFFRQGAVEFVFVFLFTETESFKKAIFVDTLEANMRNFLGKTSELYKEISIIPPFFFWLSLLGVKGYMVAKDRRGLLFQPGNYRIDRNDLLLPSWVIEDFEVPIDKIVQEALDIIWNSAGFTGRPVSN